MVALPFFVGVLQGKYIVSPADCTEFMRHLLPYADQALPALVEGIYAQGIDCKVLLVAVGEFGRTPRISYGLRSGSTDRDQWPQASTTLGQPGSRSNCLRKLPQLALAHV